MLLLSFWFFVSGALLWGAAWKNKRDCEDLLRDIRREGARLVAREGRY